MKLSQKKKAGTILLVSIAVIITAIHIIPLLVILLNSFRSNQEIEMQMLAFPTSLDFTNYIVAWERRRICGGLPKQFDHRCQHRRR